MPGRLLLRSQRSNAPLAQLAEQRTLNPRVRGSSPWRRTRSDLGFYHLRAYVMILCGAGLRPSWGHYGSPSFECAGGMRGLGRGAGRFLAGPLMPVRRCAVVRLVSFLRRLARGSRARTSQENTLPGCGDHARLRCRERGWPIWRAAWARDRRTTGGWRTLRPARTLPRRLRLACRRRRRRVPGIRRPAWMMRVATFSAAVWATAGSTEVYVSAVSTMLECPSMSCTTRKSTRNSPRPPRYSAPRWPGAGG